MTEGKKIPHLVAVLVGNDGASETYVASKVKACQAVGMKSSELRYGDDITEEQLLAVIDKLNEDPDVDGFIVQLPLLLQEVYNSHEFVEQLILPLELSLFPVSQTLTLHK